ncbi:hypothetical protein QBC42DRAFT_264340 [Cladorrhinum samala]|uniref:CYTH domain-containing protein n=1 Tax=Cladorrhinum samala TaxID=585594 RepID=A0AAV9HUW5_9PEZI|nr:hypothetical protein QBC42DRAFT_264340 [Cladorrhinum samala]
MAVMARFTTRVLAAAQSLPLSPAIHRTSSHPTCRMYASSSAGWEQSLKLVGHKEPSPELAEDEELSEISGKGKKKINKQPPFELEVDRRFAGLKVPDLITHAGDPPFPDIERLPTRTIHDVYYDTADLRMASRGVWARKRDGKWQAKMSLGAAGKGGCNRALFQQFNTERQVGVLVHGRAMVRARIKNPSLPEEGQPWDRWRDNNWGLKVIADFVTERQGWKVVIGKGTSARTYHVYWDKTDFGYEVGEIESYTSTIKKTQRDSWKRELGMKVDKRIDELIGKHQWAFEVSDKVPKSGKLFEYLLRHRREDLGKLDVNRRIRLA